MEKKLYEELTRELERIGVEYEYRKEYNELNMDYRKRDMRKVLEEEVEFFYEYLIGKGILREYEKENGIKKEEKKRGIEYHTLVEKYIAVNGDSEGKIRMCDIIGEAGGSCYNTDGDDRDGYNVSVNVENTELEIINRSMLKEMVKMMKEIKILKKDVEELGEYKLKWECRPSCKYCGSEGGEIFKEEMKKLKEEGLIGEEKLEEKKK